MPAKIKILVMRTDRIGDLILSTPAIESLRNLYPNAHIAVMVTSNTKAILENNPFIDEIIVYEKKNRLLKNIVEAIKLRKRKFDIVIVLHPNNRSHILAFLSGARIRIGFKRNLGFLLTKTIPHNKQLGEKHESDYTMDIIRVLSANAMKGNLFMTFTKEDLTQVKKLLGKFAIPENTNIICIHTGSSCKSRIWPLENFLTLAEKIVLGISNTAVIFIGDKTVQEILKKHNFSNPKITSLCGILSLNQTLALIKLSKLLVSTDSGPVHMASCVDTPSITLFGRKNPGLSPKRWAPLGKNNIVIHKDVGCVICKAHNCEKELLCLKSITPEEVYISAKKILEK